LTLAAAGARLPAAALAGCLFALGYGIILPTCVEWSSRPFRPAERARPVALINTIFHVGAIISLQIVGSALALIGWPGVLVLLTAIVLSIAALIGIRLIGDLSRLSRPALLGLAHRDRFRARIRPADQRKADAGIPAEPPKRA